MWTRSYGTTSIIHRGGEHDDDSSGDHSSPQGSDEGSQEPIDQEEGIKMYEDLEEQRQY